MRRKACSGGNEDVLQNSELRGHIEQNTADAAKRGVDFEDNTCYFG